MKIIKIVVVSLVFLLLNSGLAQASILGKFFEPISNFLGSLFGDDECAWSDWIDYKCGTNCPGPEYMRQYKYKKEGCPAPRYEYQCVKSDKCDDEGNKWDCNIRV